MVFEFSRLVGSYDNLKEVLRYLSSKGYRLWVVTLLTWSEIYEHSREGLNKFEN